MDANLFANLDLDALLASFSGVEPAAVSGLVVPSPPPPMHDAEAGSPESVTSRANPPGEEVLSEIERFLMEEGEAEVGGVVEGISVEEFFDALYDGGEVEREEKGKESEAGGSTDGDSGREEEEVTPEAEKVEVDGDDPVSKKKRRQMRNRDSAMKSRERKKTYIKDLETKSKYLEAECRRLSYALQCYAAENMALRQSVLKDRPVGAHTAMQESAVLTETLPLVSLLWLVSIVCLFLMPGLPNRSPAAPRSTGRDLVTVARKTSSEIPEILELILHGRRCKGTRAKIKLDTLPFHAAAAC
ncbi:bZIP transcription factor 50-like [Phragmites australis]|uniref:bZIP transcription factor 50-like n=1 Tax=Phragmites australis TaxID=29695 RepID=UPI002D77FF52|nr:bZIP transcription factor 50-like [Phragmites australis]